MIPIERAFVNLDEGQMHLRRLKGEPGQSPIILLHASPASSWFMQGMMKDLRSKGFAGDVLAPDTLGNGDSDAPAPEEPDIPYFADSVRRMLDALGYDKAHVYGTHTGARIACEFGAAFPDRTASVILDGITEYEDEVKQEIIENYAPVVQPDEYGRHLIWAFNFCRDQALFFPHFKKVPEHRLSVPMPPAEVLHRITLDVLKTLGTYSKPYIAAFRYEAFARMPLIKADALVLKSAGELKELNRSVEKAVSLIEKGKDLAVSPAEKAEAIVKFVKEIGQ